MFGEKPILILEDECFTALALANAVEDWNGRVVDPFASVADAMESLAAEEVAGAILDAQLADRDVTPVALHLADRGVPFVLHTGSGAPAKLLEYGGRVLVVAKPAKTDVVLACLLTEMREPGRQQLLG